MFMVDEETADAIRRVWDESGELSAVARLRAQAGSHRTSAMGWSRGAALTHDGELRRHFPFITDGASARPCVRAIVGWTPQPTPEPR